MEELFKNYNLFINRFNLVFHIGKNGKASSSIGSIAVFRIERKMLIKIFGYKDITRRYVIDNLTGELLSCRQFESKWGRKFDKIVKLQTPMLQELVDGYENN